MRDTAPSWTATPHRALCSLSSTGWTGVSALSFHLSLHYILPVSFINLSRRQSLHLFLFIRGSGLFIFKWWYPSSLICTEYFNVSLYAPLNVFILKDNIALFPFATILQYVCTISFLLLLYLSDSVIFSVLSSSFSLLYFLFFSISLTPFRRFSPHRATPYPSKWTSSGGQRWQPILCPFENWRQQEWLHLQCPVPGNTHHSGKRTHHSDCQPL